MRTTLTLDADVERLLKTTAHKQGKSFKVVLNDGVRQNTNGLRAGFDWHNLSDQADNLDDQETVARMRGPEGRLKN